MTLLASKCFAFKLDALKQAKMPTAEEAGQHFENFPSVFANNGHRTDTQYPAKVRGWLASGSCWNVDDVKKPQAAPDEYAAAEQSVRLSKGKTMMEAKNVLFPPFTSESDEFELLI